MDTSDLTTAQQIAEAATAFEQQTTGRLPRSVTVVLNEDTLVITLRRILSPAESNLAKSREGAAELREFYRQLLTTAFEPLREEIRRITGVEVREATAEFEATTGTEVWVFLLARAVPADTWSTREGGAQSQQGRY